MSEQKPAKKPTEIPKFDHRGVVTLSVGPHGKSLMQNGFTFTYAELNKQTGLYEPEPRYIPASALAKDGLRTLLEKALVRMNDHEIFLQRLQKEILDAMPSVFEE